MRRTLRLLGIFLVANMAGAIVSAAAPIIRIEPQPNAPVHIQDCSLLADGTIQIFMENKLSTALPVDVRVRVRGKAGAFLADEIFPNLEGSGNIVVRPIAWGTVIDPSYIESLTCSIERAWQGMGDFVAADADTTCRSTPMHVDAGVEVKPEVYAFGSDWAAASFVTRVVTFFPFGRSTLQDDPIVIQLDRNAPAEFLVSEQQPRVVVRFIKLSPGVHFMHFAEERDFEDFSTRSDLGGWTMCFRMPRP